MVAAISALIAAIPVRQRFNPSDLFLAADSLTYTYTLCLTLAAMFSQSSLALNSVAGPTVDLVLACRSIAPTIIVASADTAAKLHAETAEKGTGPLAKLACWIQSRALEAGRMPVDSFFTRMNAPKTAAIGTTPGKLRLIFVAEKAGIDTPALSSNQLSDLRIFMSARPVYALTAAKVAGAVAQTMMYDYRRDGYNQSHFGLPMSSVEVKLVDKGEAKTTEETTRGEVRYLSSTAYFRGLTSCSDCCDRSFRRWRRNPIGRSGHDSGRQYPSIPIGQQSCICTQF